MKLDDFEFDYENAGRRQIEEHHSRKFYYTIGLMGAITLIPLLWVNRLYGPRQVQPVAPAPLEVITANTQGNPAIPETFTINRETRDTVYISIDGIAQRN